MSDWMRARAAGVARIVAATAAAVAIAGAGCGTADPPGFSADSALVHVRTQLAFGPRVSGTDARDRCMRYIARTLERYGARVRVQPFEVDDPYSSKPIRMFNLIGSYGIDRSPRLMLASHYDTRPWADQEPDSTKWTTPIPGAVDGATSAAILLELARLAGAQPPGTIGVDFVFFDGEDYGKEKDVDHYLLGSRHFAANLEGYRPAAVILLDMVGGKGTRVRREGFSEQEAAPLLDYVFARAKSLGLSYFEPAAGGPIFDDHVPLLQTGLHAIDLFGYDYAAWHTLADDATQCDPETIGQTGVLLRSLMYDFGYPSR